MSIGISERTDYGTAKTLVKVVTSHFRERRSWIRCPRCIGGTMYKEHNYEYVCLQCGCSYYPDKTTRKRKVNEESASESGMIQMKSVGQDSG